MPFNLSVNSLFTSLFSLFMHSFCTHLWSNHTVLAAAVGNGKGPQRKPQSSGQHSADSQAGNPVSFPQYQLNPKISGKLVPGVPKCAGATVDPKTYSQSLCKLMSIESVMPFVIPFPSCLQSFPALGSFPVSQLFTSGSQSIGASVSASILPMNIQE